MAPTMPDFNGVSGPDPIVGSVYALRSFTVTDDGVLVGVTYPQPALDGVNVATCGHLAPMVGPSHEAPMEGCTCGFYAYDQQGTGTRPFSRSGADAVVELSGKIILCERGLKAARMKVVALALDPRTSAKTRALVEQNYPSTHPFLDEKAMLAEFPLSPISREGQTEDGVRGHMARGVAKAKSLATGARVDHCLRALLRRSLPVLVVNMLAVNILPVTGMAYIGFLTLVLAYASTVKTVSRAVSSTALMFLFMPYVDQFVTWSATHPGMPWYGSASIPIPRSGIFAVFSPETVADRMLNLTYLAFGFQMMSTLRRERAWRKTLRTGQVQVTVPKAFGVATAIRPTLPARVVQAGKVPPGINVITTQARDNAK